MEGSTYLRAASGTLCPFSSLFTNFGNVSFREAKAIMNEGCCLYLEKSQVVDLWISWLTWLHLTQMTHFKSHMSTFLALCALHHVGFVSLEALDLFSNVCWILILVLRSYGFLCPACDPPGLWHHCLVSPWYPFVLLWLVFCLCSSIFWVTLLDRL